MKQRFYSSVFGCALLLLWGCGNVTKEQKTDRSAAEISAVEPTYKIILPGEVEWTHLNPKRGDLAPKAGTLWGDRNGTGPTGFLLKPTDGFKSPPHIHNVSYRGIVIQGLFHNDDPDAVNMWMPAGSFWTQPKGEIHITAAEGANSLAYIEIEEGPYLVLSEDEHFDSGERPLNVDRSNIVWVDGNDLSWAESSASNGTNVAFLWGRPVANELNGTFLSLPPGFNGKIFTKDSPFRAIVVKGEAQYQQPDQNKVTTLPTGSFFSSEKKSFHTLANASDKEVIIYIRSYGAYEVI